MNEPDVTGPMVLLLAHTPEPEILCCVAAKLCHEPDDFQAATGKYHTLEEMCAWLRENPKHVARVLYIVKNNGHDSVLEHAVFTFYLENVSRALTHQLVRHRIASYSQQSQRYVRMDQTSYVIPPSLRGDHEATERYEKMMRDAWDNYAELTRRGLPPQDARFVLPNATTTKIVVTMNARSLLNFFNIRTDLHAQWEIRRVASMMLKKVKRVAPLLFDMYDLCPKCDGVTRARDFKPHVHEQKCSCARSTE